MVLDKYVQLKWFYSSFLQNGLFKGLKSEKQAQLLASRTLWKYISLACFSKKAVKPELFKTFCNSVIISYLMPKKVLETSKISSPNQWIFYHLRQSLFIDDERIVAISIFTPKREVAICVASKRVLFNIAQNYLSVHNYIHWPYIFSWFWIFND